MLGYVTFGGICRKRHNQIATTNKRRIQSSCFCKDRW
jgi:hypothetical protein